MHTESREPRAVTGARLERAVVLQLLRDDREQEWSTRQLAVEMDVEAPVLERALRSLQRDGVLCLGQEAARASRATRRLDELGLLGV
jgi:DNA-binding transcriptional regulator YhcF (GntR family)